MVQWIWTCFSELRVDKWAGQLARCKQNSLLCWAIRSKTKNISFGIQLWVYLFSLTSIASGLKRLVCWVFFIPFFFASRKFYDFNQMNVITWNVFKAYVSAFSHSRSAIPADGKPQSLNFYWEYREQFHDR